MSQQGKPPRGKGYWQARKNKGPPPKEKSASWADASEDEVQPKSSESKDSRPAQSRNASQPNRPAQKNTMGAKPQRGTQVTVTHPPTKITEMKDDPLITDSFPADAVNALIQDPGALRFELTYDALPSLIRSVHQELVARDINVMKTLPESMFAHYMITVFWARLCAIRYEHGEAINATEHSLLEATAGGNYVVPSTLQTYLDGIGDLVDKEGNEWKHMVATIPSDIRVAGVQGWFGRVTADSHHLYGSLPCPGVSAYRMVQDITYNTVHTPQEWDLPDAIRPEEILDADGQPGLPTQNLLGWSRATTMRPETIAVLESVGVHAAGFDSVGAFAYSASLMQYVSAWLLRLAQRYKMSTAFNRSRFGSTAQSMRQVRSLDWTGFIRTQYYCDDGIRVRSNSQFDARQVHAVTVFVYRLFREQILYAGQARNIWCVYDWDDYAHVPPAWIATRNAELLSGRAALWDAINLSTAPTERARLLTYYIRTGVVSDK